MSKTTKAELREQLVNAAARSRRLVAANERLLTEAREARRAAEAAEAARQEALGVAPLLASVAQEALQAAGAAREERERGREQMQRRAEEAEAQRDRAAELLRNLAARGPAGFDWWAQRDALLRELS